jgi:abortive infection bacteriophage resistance protein
MKYSKPPLSTPEHIKRLKKRGLVISDEHKAAQYFNNIGYYRLSAYFIPFEQIEQQAAMQRQFKPDTQFDDILDLYIFDRKLRLIVIEGIERIEVAIRTQWANKLAETNQDPHAFMQSKHFKDPWSHQKKLAKVANTLKDSGEVFVKHYRDKYTNPFLPPIWAMVETLTFGELSQWFSNTADAPMKKSIAKQFNLPTVEIMQSVMQSLSLIRNICAHHGRLWNRRLVKQLPYIRKLSAVLQAEQGSSQPKKEIYNYLVIMSVMMKAIQPDSKWQQHLKTHIQTTSTDQQQSMGFPADWSYQVFWLNDNKAVT